MSDDDQRGAPPPANHSPGAPDRDQEREAEDERDARRDERDARRDEREARRAEGEAEREARHAEREARREARGAERISRRFQYRSGPHGGFTIDGREFDAASFAKSFVAGFVSDAGGDTYGETLENTFTFDGRTPRLRVRNVSGETTVVAADSDEIKVVARKQVSASSEDRAKRLLQNLEVRIEKRGDELRVEPHLYEQERGWLDLFRGKRFRVDFDITVPRECAVDAQTVSGELSVEGVRGPVEAQSVSGDVRLDDLQGPLRLKTVSGDVDGRRYVGHLEGNTVSGDIALRVVRLRSCHLQTVSGDVEIEGALDAGREHRFRSISGDVELALAEPDVTVDFRTASGDLECDTAARVVRHGKKEYEVVLGAGRGSVAVKTVSGDLTVRGTSVAPPGEPGAAAAEPAPEDLAERTQPMEPPREDAREDVRAVLERLARGELGVDDAAAALDAVRRGS